MSISLFYIDDDNDDLDLLQQAASELHVAVTLFTDYQSMLLTTQAGVKPDAIFLDFNIPGSNAFHAVEAIRTEGSLKYVPIVIYSAHLNDDDMTKMIAAGATTYIQKSMWYGGIKEAIQKIIDIVNLP